MTSTHNFLSKEAWISQTIYGNFSLFQEWLKKGWSVMTENIPYNIGTETTSRLYMLFLTLVIIFACSSLIRLRSIRKRRTKVLSPFRTDSEGPSGVLDQFSDKDRWRLQTLVANARSVDDLLNIFVEFQELQSLQLPTISDISTESHLVKAQAFRDLVRERVVVNDTPVEPGISPSSDPSQFERDFEAHIQNAISRHVPDSNKRTNISMHLCCHLSRTRAGGDSFFAVQDVFTSPQLILTASPHYTHPPTDLLITDDGWAVITTTSNFDVYLEKDIAENADDHPEPLVTISALTEEAIPIAESAQQSELAKFGQVSSPNDSSPASSSQQYIEQNHQNSAKFSKNRKTFAVDSPTDLGSSSSKTSSVRDLISTFNPFSTTNSTSTQSYDKYDEKPLPIYRTLRLSCALPQLHAHSNQWDFPPETRIHDRMDDIQSTGHSNLNQNSFHESFDDNLTTTEHSTSSEFDSTHYSNNNNNSNNYGYNNSINNSNNSNYHGDTSNRYLSGTSSSRSGKGSAIEYDELKRRFEEAGTRPRSRSNSFSSGAAAGSGGAGSAAGMDASGYRANSHPQSSSARERGIAFPSGSSSSFSSRLAGSSERAGGPVSGHGKVENRSSESSSGSLFRHPSRATAATAKGASRDDYSKHSSQMNTSSKSVSQHYPLPPQRRADHGHAHSEHGHHGEMELRQRITDDSLHGLRELGHLAFRRTDRLDSSSMSTSIKSLPPTVNYTGKGGYNNNHRGGNKVYEPAYRSSDSLVGEAGEYPMTIPNPATRTVSVDRYYMKSE